MDITLSTTNPYFLPESKYPKEIKHSQIKNTADPTSAIEKIIKYKDEKKHNCAARFLPLKISNTLLYNIYIKGV